MYYEEDTIQIHLCEKYFLKILDYAPESKNNRNEGQPIWEQGQDRDLDVMVLSLLSLSVCSIWFITVWWHYSQFFSCGSNMATFAQLLNTEKIYLFSSNLYLEHSREGHWSRPIAAPWPCHHNHCLATSVTGCWGYDHVIGSPQQNRRALLPREQISGAQWINNHSHFQIAPSAISHWEVIVHFYKWENRINFQLMHMQSHTHAHTCSTHTHTYTHSENGGTGK